ncbi:hypothetical protein AGOR_G00132890 [Albula goreensis]|uniref:LRRCT domain-containing protein n=1 Tax=Albula goreensis TaxID=1534307 RepID=A0A8T3D8K5_9TELE|nr:hypothetical protein AGOR_G00132890 [Albula goreensis]
MHDSIALRAFWTDIRQESGTHSSSPAQNTEALRHGYQEPPHPNAIGQLLLLWRNRLQELPADLLSGVPHLHTLDLTGNQLQDLPAGVFSHSLLRSVVLKENRLSSADAHWFPPNSSLTWLDLSFNQLTVIPTALLQHLPHLETLHLNNNKLEKIPTGALVPLPHLQRLHLEGNKLSFLEPSSFQNFPNLTNLFLQENRLEKLSPGLFQGLPHLDVLSLEQNRLRSLPPGLLDQLPALGTSSVQGLDLSLNPWDCDSNIEYVWNWLKGHQDKAFSLEDVKCATPKSLHGRPLVKLTAEEWRRGEEGGKEQ